MAHPPLSLEELTERLIALEKRVDGDGKPKKKPAAAKKK
jgi:hypothetical protein